MKEALSVLQAAIDPVGYWLHWEHRIPESLQVQFGGVQLLTEPLSAGDSQSAAAAVQRAPAGQLALRFLRLTAVTFLWHHSAPASLLPDWPERLRHDDFGPCDLTPGTLTFSDPAAVLAVLQHSRRIMSAHGVDPRFDGLLASPLRMAFFAGPVGLVVGAEELQLFAPTGPVALADVPEHRERWLAYRRRYFDAKAAGAPLPEDYTCEAAGPPAMAT